MNDRKACESGHDERAVLCAKWAATIGKFCDGKLSTLGKISSKFFGGKVTNNTLCAWGHGRRFTHTWAMKAVLDAFDEGVTCSFDYCQFHLRKMVADDKRFEAKLRHLGLNKSEIKKLGSGRIPKEIEWVLPYLLHAVRKVVDLPVEVNPKDLNKAILKEMSKVARRNLPEDPRERRIVELYHGLTGPRMSVRKIGAELGISGARVHKILQRLKIPTRSRSAVHVSVEEKMEKVDAHA